MRSREYYQIREQFTIAAAEQKTPIYGHYELTSRCNLDCKMCYVHTQNNAEALRNELTTDQWKRIFDEAYECELLYATLSGGECLLRSDFKELYLYLWNKNIFVSVFTNGTLINDDYIEFFKTYCPDRIQISLYGSNEEGYLNVTGHKGFEKTIYAIDSLLAAGIDVDVAVTPSKYMQDDYIRILELCKNKKYRVGYQDLFLLPNRDNPDKDDYFLTFDEIVSLSTRRAELHAPVVPLDNVPEPCKCTNGTVKKGLTCNAGNCLASVTHNGIMYPCYNAMTGGVSLLEKSYKEAWKETVKAASEVVLSSECEGCPYDKTCPHCPAFRLKDLRGGHCNPATCELTRKLVAAGVKKLEPVD